MPLILDGASGVGKMQQAFALLQSGKHLIHSNLSCIYHTSQQIYIKMENNAFLKQTVYTIDKVIADIEQSNLVINDKLSTSSMYTVLASCLRSKELTNLKHLILELQK